MKKIDVYDIVYGRSYRDYEITEEYGDLESLLYALLDEDSPSDLRENERIAIEEAIEDSLSTIQSIPNRGEFTNHTLQLRFTVYSN